MFRLSLFLSVLLFVSTPILARELLRPDPSLSPAHVVKIQLQALQRNDEPTPDAGIAQTWAFAHPDNKRMTGPLEKFAQMLKGPSYRMLLGHLEHTIKTVVGSNQTVLFNVTVVTADNQRVSFQWTLSKVRSGPLSGAWMTIGVSPPLRAKDSI